MDRLGFREDLTIANESEPLAFVLLPVDLEMFQSGDNLVIRDLGSEDPTPQEIVIEDHLGSSGQIETFVFADIHNIRFFDDSDFFELDLRTQCDLGDCFDLLTLPELALAEVADRLEYRFAD